jgi:uroporphyrinogen decarboxylase
MDARENALRIIRFEGPERIVGGPPRADVSYFGVNHEPFGGVGGHDSPLGTRWTDIWGVGWRKELPGVMGYAVHHPLADLGALRSYRWPDPDDPRICGAIHEKAGRIERAGRFVSGSHRETLWERSYNLVGMDNLMVSFHLEPNAVRDVLHHVMDFQLGIARHYAEAGIEWAGLGDDLGTQRGLLFSPEILHEFFVPEYRRLVGFYKPRGVLIGFHSCGRIQSILEVFMDLGVDVLNPIQATANDLDEVRRVTAGRMALMGGVSSFLVRDGPVERIRRTARERMWQLGREGGYFCGPDQGLDFPDAHVEALEAAVAEYGAYPLQPPGEE